jgi:hypothetical protein
VGSRPRLHAAAAARLKTRRAYDEMIGDMHNFIKRKRRRTNSLACASCLVLNGTTGNLKIISYAFLTLNLKP